MRNKELIKHFKSGAKLIAEKHARCCCAALQISPYNLYAPALEIYAKYFQPECMNPADYWWPVPAPEPRILALLLMAEILKDLPEIPL